MDAWGSARGLGDIDVLARLREHVSRLDIVRGGDASDVDVALQASREEEEMREFEEGILAEALLQSKHEAIAMAGAGEGRRFQVIALGYTRAGESEMCSPDDRTTDLAVTVRSSAGGAWKAAVPLFRFVVIQTNSFGEEQARSCITKSRDDFEALHEKLQDELRARSGSAEVSRLHIATHPRRTCCRAYRSTWRRACDSCFRAGMGLEASTGLPAPTQPRNSCCPLLGFAVSGKRVASHHHEC